MRLIDADKLVKTFCSHCVDHDECKSECMDLKIIKSMKTVDAEPTIRCKDCKYWNKHHFVDIYVCSIHNKEGRYPYLLFEMNTDDFCSKGEKR